MPPLAVLVRRGVRQGLGEDWDLAKVRAAADVPASIPALLARNVAQFGSKPAYREKEFGIWQSWTWAEVAEQIDAIALGLLTLGVNRG